MTEAPLPVRQRSRVRKLILALVGGAVMAGAGAWLYQQFTHVTIADARIAADMVAVSSRVPGQIVNLQARQGARVKAGEPLIVLDSRESQLNIDALDAQLASIQSRREEIEARIAQTDRQTEAGINAQRARVRATEAALASVKARMAQAQADDERAERLAPQGVVTGERLEQARLALETARQQVLTAEAELQSAQAALTQAEAGRDQLTVLKRQLAELGPEEQQVRIQRSKAELALADRTVVMPVDGVVDQISVDEAEYVSPGQRMLLVHNPDQVRVEANVKETDIRYFNPGKAVRVTVDAFPDRVFEGRVEDVGQAATSEFALLPSPNPSGNFTKVSQRLQVRIAIDSQDALLKPGMMVEVEATTGG